MLEIIIMIGLVIGIVLVWVLFLYGWHFAKAIKGFFKRRRNRG
jgi:hypothetical protein